MAYMALNYSFINHNFRDIHLEKSGLFFPVVTTLSAGLGGWLRKLHKGTDDFMRAGALTWIFFTLALMLWLAGGAIYNWNTLSSYNLLNIAGSIVVGVLFFSTPMSLPAATAGTLVFMTVMFVIRRMAKLFKKKSG